MISIYKSLTFITHCIIILGILQFKSLNAQSKIPNSCKQLLVTISPKIQSFQGSIMAYERTSSKKTWQFIWSKPKPVLLGRFGMAWGIGVAGQNEPGEKKREGDAKTPMGIFKIGQIYGHPKSLPSGSSFPYRQLTKWDAWIDDSKNPLYNKHIVVNPMKIPSWYEKQKMKITDDAYKYRIEIRHNADRPIPYMGSAIFFHIRRSSTKPTAGCTVMKERDLINVIRWLRKDKNPHYVALPYEIYLNKMHKWELPKIN